MASKVVQLDGAGAGSVHVPPSFYVGVDGATNVNSEGADYGTAQLTAGTGKFIEGQVNVAGGAPNGQATIFLIDR